jgi:hypothetical protein
MSIKLIFHIAAIISGVLAGSCAFLSSNNRLVLFVVFSSIAVIFEIAIPFIKISPIKVPKPYFSITLMPSNYRAGLEIYGVTWEEDYKEYNFDFKNMSDVTDLEDLRISIELPGVFVNYFTDTQTGSHDITFSQEQNIAGIVSKQTNVMRDTFDYYTNFLYINVVKLFPQGRFSIKMIIKNPNPNIEGHISIKCRYVDSERKTNYKSIAHKIVFRNVKSKSLYIDDSELVSEYTANYMMVPKIPLLFKKDGSIQVEK